MSARLQQAPLALRKVVTAIPEVLQPKPKQTVRAMAFAADGTCVHDVIGEAYSGMLRAAVPAPVVEAEATPEPIEPPPLRVETSVAPARRPPTTLVQEPIDMPSPRFNGALCVGICHPCEGARPDQL